MIVSDTFGRPWRRGLTDVAIGVAGIAAVVDLRGTADALGRELQVTEVCVADELAAAAELVMGKASGVAAAIVRGCPAEWFREGSVRTRSSARPPKTCSASRLPATMVPSHAATPCDTESHSLAIVSTAGLRWRSGLKSSGRRAAALPPPVR